ncbi:MAG: sulfatase/phosphatase domain-containing protein, partial [Planctomycetaceae bacterium]
EQRPLLTTILTAAGVPTRLLCEEDPAASPFTEGFAEVQGRFASSRGGGTEADAPFARLLSAAASVLQNPGDDRHGSLLWLKSSGVPAGPQPRGRRSFADKVPLLDRHLGKLLEAALADDVLFVVAAGRGEWPGHRHQLPEGCESLAECAVHTPLFVRVPGEEQGTRRRDFVQTTDLVPTLLDAFGLDPRGCDGTSLLPLVRGESQTPRDFVPLGEGRRCVAIHTDDYALIAPVNDAGTIEPAAASLFVKPDDFWEVSNVRDQAPNVAEALARTLEEFVARTG